MGRGIALEAMQRYPYLPQVLGDTIAKNGLRVELFFTDKLIAFPVKYHFKDKADINLILRSTIQLVDASQRIEGRILMGRPGCGWGHLDWVEVEPMLQHYLVDDRFVIFSKPMKGL